MTVEADSLQDVEEYKEDSSHQCAEKLSTDSENTAVIAIAVSTIIAIGMLLLLIIVTLACTVFWHSKRKVKRLKESVRAGISVNDDQQLNYSQFEALNHRSRPNLVESNHSYVINSLGGRSNRTFRERNRTYLALSSHSYVINSLGQFKKGITVEDQYWAPASKEEELKQQLKKSKVNEVHKNVIE